MRVADIFKAGVDGLRDKRDSETMRGLHSQSWRERNVLPRNCGSNVSKVQWHLGGGQEEIQPFIPSITLFYQTY